MTCDTTIRQFMSEINDANIDDSNLELLVDGSFYSGLFIVLLYLHFSDHLGGDESTPTADTFIAFIRASDFEGGEKTDVTTEITRLDSESTDYKIEEIYIAIINLLVQKELSIDTDYTNAIISTLIEYRVIDLSTLTNYVAGYGNGISADTLKADMLDALSDSDDVETYIDNWVSYVEDVPLPSFGVGDVTLPAEITCASGYQGTPSINCSEDGTLTYGGCTLIPIASTASTASSGSSGSISGGTQQSSNYDGSFNLSWKHIFGCILFVFIFLAVMSFVEIKKK